MTMHAYFLLPILLLCGCQAIYVPGVTPNEFRKGDSIEIKAVKLTSTKTQLPYDYYTVRFCRPQGELAYVPETIGEILRGDRVVNTPYAVKMGEPTTCTLVCPPFKIEANEAKKFRQFIENEYWVHLVIDNLPVATKYRSGPSNNIYYDLGYKMGFLSSGHAFINNHLSFTILYHKVGSDRFRIVGFEVEPSSISQKQMTIEKDKCTIEKNDGFPALNWKLVTDEALDLHFSYEVKWEESSIVWASRWDIYFNVHSGQVHWFSIVNSVIIVLFLTAVITMILVRTLRRDIAKYNNDEDAEDILEESGWKLVHGDVFRPPRHTRLLTALFGSGVQIFCMMFIVIFFAMLGTLSPAARGAIMSAAIFTYVFMGLFAGYFAGRMYKTMRGQLWKSTALSTGLLFPMGALTVGLILNLFAWSKGSSAAIPFTTILALVALWLCISLPLVFVGFFFGFRKRPYDQPVRTNQIPRAVPDQKFHHHLFVTTLCAGMLPFGAVFIELFFVFTAIWESQFYYLFGFLFIVFIILIISVAQVAIVLTYFQLCSEDYHWWWKSLISSGGSAIYMLGYSVFYFLTKMTITEFVPVIFYFGYSLLMAATLWILTGSIGFYASFVFLRYIYAAIKID